MYQILSVKTLPRVKLTQIHLNPVFFLDKVICQIFNEFDKTFQNAYTICITNKKYNRIYIKEYLAKCYKLQSYQLPKTCLKFATKTFKNSVNLVPRYQKPPYELILFRTLNIFLLAE